MLVRQLVGRAAGTIIDMPYHAAQAALATGSCKTVTDEEVAEAGIEVIQQAAAVPEDHIPAGYKIVMDEVQGYLVADAGGVVLREEPFPNIVAARSFAQNHHAHASGQSAAQAARAGKANAEETRDRHETGDENAGDEGDGSDSDEGEGQGDEQGEGDVTEAGARPGRKQRGRK
jgi:cobalamin biosynthesis protein CobT